jgi:hypothetical protein
MNEANNQPNFTAPLFATTKDAARLFGIGRTRLYELRRDHEDFRALTIKTGRDVLFDIMRCYQWFREHCGGELE